MWQQALARLLRLDRCVVHRLSSTEIRVKAAHNPAKPPAWWGAETWVPEERWVQGADTWVPEEMAALPSNGVAAAAVASLPSMPNGTFI